MNMSDVTNRQHYMPTMNHLASPDVPLPLQFQSSSLGFGIDPQSDTLGFSGRPSANMPMLASAAGSAPAKSGGFFGKLFGAIGSVFGAISKAVSSVTSFLAPLVSMVAPFFGPVGVALSGAVNMAGQALRFATDKVDSTISALRNLFKS
ncbi:hypothetical protein ICY20_12275 [Pseudomonas sp. P115]|uniref:hypothetical protein n=1 Tax=Pseudomonas pisciculturae TaxID=2730413 RepID=UPI0018921933|nr:hypothetical protein [Pseudomonas pisciculturae]MBF6028514.1 hypothetical protein [Pseudomonas pisciculturae]